MNRDCMHGLWTQLRGIVRQQWGTLTGDPLAVAAGAHLRLAGRIQKLRGSAKRRADRQLEEFMRRNRHWRDLSRG